MRTRLKTISGATAALVALALGGSAIASATQGTGNTPAPSRHAATRASEKTGGVDTDAVQSGDQSAPDTKAGDTADAGSKMTAGTESSGENSSESESVSDGPGGHEDAEGNVDHQEETQE